MSSQPSNSRRTAAQEPPDAALVERYSGAMRQLRDRLSERIVGQEQVVTQVLTTILSEGHCLIIGVPGLAKTLLIQSISELLSLDFKRIQFTPDLMPSDIMGATLLDDDGTGQRDYQFLRGPIFANLILADEINRTPAKTQSALMEAMEERQVTAWGRDVPLPRPFFVLATQNPIEQQGTYPLPISQLDRFQQSIRIDYPSPEEEFRIVQMTTSNYSSNLEPLLSHDDVIAAIDCTRRVTCPEKLIEYASRIVRATRPADVGARSQAKPEKDSENTAESQSGDGEETAALSIHDAISWGAGPRAIQALMAGARASAFLDGRSEARPDDVHAVAHSTLRHRLILTYHAEAEGTDVDEIIERVLLDMPDRLYTPPRSEKLESQETQRRGLWQKLLGRTGRAS